MMQESEIRPVEMNPSRVGTQSSENTEPQLLLESGPMLLRDFNPKGVLRFQGRKCITCSAEIMDHWLIDSPDADAKGRYWCSKDGKQWSEGITDCQYDVPEGFGVPPQDFGSTIQQEQ